MDKKTDKDPDLVPLSADELKSLADPQSNKALLSRALHGNKRLATNLIQLFRTVHQLWCDHEATSKSRRPRALTVREVLKIIMGECYDIISEHGFEPFAPAPGEAFSAASCEAVVSVPACAGKEAGRVISVYSPGYRSGVTGDIVVKARVSVSVAVAETSH